MKFYVLLIFGLVAVCVAKNKYSKEANQPEFKPKHAAVGGSNDDAPFRMAKINQVWTKARKVLSPGKLESLRAELLLHDKQELTWKRLKNEGGDKDGLKEAQLRAHLLETLNRFDLGRYHPSGGSAPARAPAEADAAAAAAPTASMHRLFKDKKLNRLWEKAEKAGFSQEELKALRQEFQHHQDRIDEYYLLMEEQQQAREQHEEMSNSIHEEDESAATSLKKKSRADYKSRINELHEQVREGYSRLHVASVSGPDSRDFTEPKVDGLWQMARKADFNAEELDSLWSELKHYEQRLQKLRHVQMDMLTADQRHHGDHVPDKTEGRKVYDRKIKDQERHVEKLQLMLEDKILSRHTEL